MEESNVKKFQTNRLLFFGVLLFFLGLLVGLFIPLMANPRMGLTTHLEGVMNGILLVALGLIWAKIEVSAFWLKTAFWLSLYGSFANFIAVLIAAITGSGKMMPIAGGQEGSAFVEGIISFLLISLALAMLTVCIIVLSGIYRHMNLEHK
ncbi:hydroxylaminobenzene mutase [Aquiflexum balticum DSM 16537]|uniref:Hydroxylaminobenzene mutase n=1 Tax=Aquiflexum balticum DSM 16537 TaxID=758820 RepID=A0A1W2H250_9BACT|nr:hydrogenase [Aquiflexum balticum]SMD42959.1 hydroxylaminobenzene mutase [Aquiflexum balticum DSM 16537]